MHITLEADYAVRIVHVWLRTVSVWTPKAFRMKRV